jgi:predicted dehydrogenase
MNRKLRMGMVGGGKDAFIGAIHRYAANMDGLIELSCGALSINPEIAVDSARSLFLPENRTYLTFDEMISKEKKLGEDRRMDFVTIVTPNFAHFAPAMMALDNGFHVVIEKPITFTLDEAKQLKKKNRGNRSHPLPNAHLFRLPYGEAGKSNGERWCSGKDQKGIC